MRLRVASDSAVRSSKMAAWVTTYLSVYPDGWLHGRQALSRSDSSVPL